MVLLEDSKTWATMLQQNYALQNVIAAVILLALLVFVIWSFRDQRGQEVWRYVFKRKMASVSFFILCFFVVVGLLDSFLWRDAILDKNGHETKSSNGDVIYESKALSILDRMLTSIRINQETTYSAPLADGQFTKNLEQDEDGKSVWVQKKLLFPGTHLLGTDAVGRDVLYIGLKGIRTALIIGGFVTLLSVPIAILLGVISGYFGKYIDVAIQFLYSTISSVPFVLIAASYILIKGANLFNLFLILGITGWPSLCRLLRGETMKTRELDYVQGARALGASHSRIIFRYVVPNIFHLALITSVLSFSGLVLAESVLSFLKIGVGQDTHSWGNMINQANLELAREPVIWWNLLGAFIFMMALILPANLFGDTLRDALDPKLRGQK